MALSGTPCRGDRRRFLITMRELKERVVVLLGRAGGEQIVVRRSVDGASAILPRSPTAPVNRDAFGMTQRRKGGAGTAEHDVSRDQNSAYARWTIRRDRARDRPTVKKLIGRGL